MTKNMLKITALFLAGTTIVVLALGYSGHSKDSHPLTVVTYNIGDVAREGPSADRVAQAILKSQKADVLLLQEVQGEKAAASLARHLDLPHYLYTDYGKGHRSGMAIIARHELHNPQVLYFKSSRRGLGVLFAQMTFRDKPLTLASVHLDRIRHLTTTPDGVKVKLGEALSILGHELLHETERSRSARELLEWISAHRYENIIIGGDFNTVPVSKTFRIMQRELRDALWPSREFFKGSYIKTPLPIAPRLDYLFHSPHITRDKARVVPKTLGDHYPVSARFLF